jgi:uncharacterized SAM-binding protein YcdF (DUF218 family)
MPKDAQAIVVLAAGFRPPDNTRLRAELDEDTLQRCLHAAELYRQRPCTVIVSGGDPDEPGPVCAQVMCEFLVHLGVKPSDIVVEDKSRTTYENAVECTKVLKQRQIRNAVLIVDAVDMLRALACFRNQGMELAPSPCHHRATEFGPTFFDFVPNLRAGQNCQRVWHEWLGMAWYWLKGRL